MAAEKPGSPASWLIIATIQLLMDNSYPVHVTMEIKPLVNAWIL